MQPSEIPPATHGNIGHYDMPAPMTSLGRAQLSAIHEATENSPREHMSSVHSFDGSRYEQLAPPCPNVTFDSLRYEKNAPTPSSMAKCHIDSARYDQIPPSTPFQFNI